ncbi:MAG: sigma-E factor negative regulatory protein [Gammaproteobacteria bacterium]
MHQDLNQKISQLLDDELDPHEAIMLLKKIQSTPDLKNTLNRYEAIRQTLKTEVFSFTDPNFSTQISRRIEQEPILFLPQRSHTHRNRKRLATAASIAVIAMIAGFNINPPTNDLQIASTVQSSAATSVNSVDTAQRNESAPDSVNKQINDYLQAHNSSVYTNGQANFHPYARVTAYSQK